MRLLRSSKVSNGAIEIRKQLASSCIEVKFPVGDNEQTRPGPADLFAADRRRRSCHFFRNYFGELP